MNRLHTATTCVAHAAIHPGDILLEEFLRPMGISRYRLAQAIEVSPRRINEIVRGTPESARRPRFVSHALLAPLTCTGSTLYWIDLQNHYDLDREREAHGPELDRIPLLLSA